MISYRFGFRFRNIFLEDNLAFHPDWAAMAPGRILLEEMIASSTDLGLRAVDASRSGLFHAHQLQEWTEEKIDHFQLWQFPIAPCAAASSICCTHAFALL